MQGFQRCLKPTGVSAKNGVSKAWNRGVRDLPFEQAPSLPRDPNPQATAELRESFLERPSPRPSGWTGGAGRAAGSVLQTQGPPCGCPRAGPRLPRSSEPLSPPETSPRGPAALGNGRGRGEDGAAGTSREALRASGPRGVSAWTQLPPSALGAAGMGARGDSSLPGGGDLTCSDHYGRRPARALGGGLPSTVNLGFGREIAKAPAPLGQ